MLQAFVVDAAIAIILATCNTALTDASYLYRSKICTCICVLSLVYYFFFNHYLQLLSVWQEQCGNHEFNHNKNNKKLKKKWKRYNEVASKEYCHQMWKKILEIVHCIRLVYRRCNFSENGVLSLVASSVRNLNKLSTCHQFLQQTHGYSHCSHCNFC